MFHMLIRASSTLLCVVKTPSGSKFKQLSAGTGTDSLL